MKTDLWTSGRTLLVALGLAGAIGVGSAQAAPELSFDDDEFDTTGTVTHTAGNPILGRNISFFSVFGSDTPSNSGARLVCNGGDGSGVRDQNNPCVMNFDTPVPSSEGSGGTGDNWEFGPGGSITITGILEDTGGTLIADGTGGTPLLSGSFTDGIVAGTSSGTPRTTLTGFGFDQKHPDLVAFFGLGPDFDFTNTSIQANTMFGPNAGDFNGNVSNADLENTPRPVPVPATLGLLGAGLIGLGILSRRRAIRT